MIRLNAWALLYMGAVGWLRFQQNGSPAPRHWRHVASMLLISILVQYIAILSPLPPTVWSEPDRRPWSDWGESWESANGTCERIGSTDPNGATSGLVCWLGVDGRLDSWLLLVDVFAFILVVPLSIKRAGHQEVLVGGPWLQVAEAVALRGFHFLTLLTTCILGLQTSNPDSVTAKEVSGG